MITSALQRDRNKKMKQKAENGRINIMITSQIVLGGLILISAGMAIFAEVTEEPHLSAPDPGKANITLTAAA